MSLPTPERVRLCKKAMQVSDLYFRLKLITFGFLSPVFLFAGFLFASPYFLKVTEPFHKSDVAILEVQTLPSKKILKSVSALYQKKTFDRIILVIREDKTENNLLTDTEKEQKLTTLLSSFNINSQIIQVLKVSPSRLGDSDEAAKAILKLIVSDNLKSILLLTKEFESKRILKVYQKNLSSLPVQISAYPFPSEFTSSNWFLSDDGFKEVSGEFLRYLYFSIRGII